MFDSLYATGPAAEAAEDLMLFGQFVGDWVFDVINYKPDGTKQEGTGEWHQSAPTAMRSTGFAVLNCGITSSANNRMLSSTYCCGRISMNWAMKLMPS